MTNLALANMSANEKSHHREVNHDSASRIIDFYSNKSIFITGSSGFLGKVLLWKLLKTCKDIKCIYVLMRPKHNMSTEKRLAQMLDGKPFSFSNMNSKQLKEKVVAINGDITRDDLGLSEEDREKLIDNVDIILHSAASVKFDAPIKENLRDNFYGTRAIVKLCSQIKNLTAYVHVSTAYSNSQMRKIEEKLVPLKMDVDEAVELIEKYPNNVKFQTFRPLLEGRPNTYTYTKALAEHHVAKHEGQFPISIVRPSIVISSVNEPCEGWVDNVNGVSGLGCMAAIGVLRTVDWNYYGVSDMVPVDYVADCIICAAYDTVKHSPNKIKFYNMTSGNSNPISWGAFFELLRAEAIKRPTNKLVRPIIKAPKHERVNRFNFFITKVFSELVFAHLIDLLLVLLGYKKFMVKITQKMHHGYKILKPFTVNQWDFVCDNVKGMSEALPDSDREQFMFDMCNFDWSKHAVSLWLGGREFILKEENTEESYEAARRRQRMITVVHYCLTFMYLTLLATLAYSSVRITRSVLPQLISI